MTRRTAYALAATAAVILALGYAARRGDGDDAAAGYVSAPVDRGPIEAVVTATGTVNPVTSVQVGTYVSGPIQALDVDFNSPVTKGQRVAKIDPAPFSVKVHQAEANVANARAKVEKSRADLVLKKILLGRNRALLAREIIARNDVDVAQSNYDQAVAQLALDEAAVRQAEAALEEARVNLAYTDITSPVDGVVVSRNVDVGQTVAATFQTPTLFLIAQDLTKMKVDASVSEADVGRVAEGQPASFTVDAYPGTRFQGTVAQVRNSPTTVQNVVTYDVVVAVDNRNLKLKPGMTANVSITTARSEDALRVPARALRFRPEQATPAPGRPAHRSPTPVVYALEANGELREVALETGIRDAEWVEVTKGDLRAGERVAIGYRRAAAGSTPATNPFSPARRF